jgi:hypothetical protein
MQETIKKIFPNSKFFIFDPSASDFRASVDLKNIYFEEEKLNYESEETYNISKPFEKIREHLLNVFKKGISEG